MWPVLLLVLARLARRARRGRVRSVSMVAAALVAIAIVSLAMAVALTARGTPWSFFSLPTRAWEFAAGGLLVCLARRATPSRRERTRFLGVAGLAMIVAAAYVINDATPFPGVATLLPVAGTMALLFSGDGRGRSPVAAVLGHRGPQWLGRVSYAWYLWHWPLMLLAVAALEHDSVGVRTGGWWWPWAWRGSPGDWWRTRSASARRCAADQAGRSRSAPRSRSPRSSWPSSSTSTLVARWTSRSSPAWPRRPTPTPRSTPTPPATRAVAERRPLLHLRRPAGPPDGHAHRRLARHPVDPGVRPGSSVARHPARRAHAGGCPSVPVTVARSSTRLVPSDGCIAFRDETRRLLGETDRRRWCSPTPTGTGGSSRRAAADLTRPGSSNCGTRRWRRWSASSSTAGSASVWCSTTPTTPTTPTSAWPASGRSRHAARRVARPSARSGRSTTASGRPSSALPAAAVGPDPRRGADPL